MWKGNSTIFRTYLKGKGKASCEKHKGIDQVHSFQDVVNYDSFGGVLSEGYIDISFDSEALSNAFWDMAEQNNWNCLILENPVNSHIHSFWKIPKHENFKKKNGKDIKLSVGLIADIHSGDTYIPLKVDGVARFPPSFEPMEVDEVPEELFPVNTSIDLWEMDEGEGRNPELFRYMYVLKSQVTSENEIIKRILSNANDFVFKKPLNQSEFETITREEAFPEDVFFKGKTFLHNELGDYLIRSNHIVKIEGKVHLFNNGIYEFNLELLEQKITDIIPTLKANQRTETLKYITLKAPQREGSPPEFIAFKNGILNINTGELESFNPDYLITNRIPWNYNSSAYSEDVERTLDKISCNDKSIRMLLEECVGYCFYRSNIMQKAFILIGDKSNGKSTFIGVLNRLLGNDNVSAMDLKNLNDRFGKATLYKKLANIGDDISDEFISDSSLFKKIVSGERIQAEFKGQPLFEFNPYSKLIFSANNIPRIKDKTGAVIRRLVIIPFNATFTEEDEDFDPYIKEKLSGSDSMEYLITLGVEGLKRILKNHKFTKSEKVQKELNDYEEFNNPVISFLKDQEEGFLFRNTTKDIYLSYSSFCHENGFIPESSNQFGRTLKSMFNVESKTKTVNKKSYRFYVKVT